MITDAFRTDSEPVITMEKIAGPRRNFCEVCVLTFSHEILENALATLAHEQVEEIRSVNGNTPLYLIEYRGRRCGFFQTRVGAAPCATFVEEANWLLGAEKFVLFGSAGCLDREAVGGKLVVPTSAYRDEGISYHYAPPADYIAVPGAEHVSRVFTELGVPHVCAPVWTTDAFYRELRCHVDARRAEGCVAVDMELAGVQAVCAFRGWELYDFLMPGDKLDLPEWEKGELNRANHCLDNLALALKIAEAL